MYVGAFSLVKLQGIITYNEKIPGALWVAWIRKDGKWSMVLRTTKEHLLKDLVVMDGSYV